MGETYYVSLHAGRGGGGTRLLRAAEAAVVAELHGVYCDAHAAMQCASATLRRLELHGCGAAPGALQALLGHCPRLAVLVIADGQGSAVAGAMGAPLAALDLDASQLALLDLSSAASLTDVTVSWAAAKDVQRTELRLPTHGGVPCLLRRLSVDGGGVLRVAARALWAVSGSTAGLLPSLTTLRLARLALSGRLPLQVEGAPELQRCELFQVRSVGPRIINSSLPNLSRNKACAPNG